MKFGLFFLVQDPPRAENIARLYDEVLEETEVAEECGFDSCLLPEHHLMPDGFLPSPLVFCGAIASRTSKILIGTGVLQLPIQHPLRVAEDSAVIDNISKGRLILGVGLGSRAEELKAFGIETKDAVSRFEESIRIIESAWTQDSFSFAGKHFKISDVSVTPKPFQKPRPPIWIGAFSEAALRRTGRLADAWFSDPLNDIQVMKASADTYRQAAQENGRKAEVVLLRDGWVAGSRKEVEEVWWPHVKEFQLSHLQHIKADSQPEIQEGKLEEEWTYERAAPNRLIAGTPEDVISEIERYRREVGCEHIVFIFRHPTGPDHKQTVKCLELFGKEVIPHFKSAEAA
ncbi:MAG: LLM class flavin-dependent oxidoreductase [Acidobacteria bacterium]|nr:LLM class flavin-dependent oxidoreductase [Acidobacteriota bacterium]